MVRRIALSLFVTLLQTIVYIVLVMFFGLIFTISNHNDFEDFFFLGLMYVLFFTAPCLFLNIIDAIVGQKWFYFISIGLPLTFYIIGWVEDIHSWPLQTIFFLIIGTVSYLSKLYFDKKLIKRQIDLANKTEQ